MAQTKTPEYDEAEVEDLLVQPIDGQLELDYDEFEAGGEDDLLDEGPEDDEEVEPDDEGADA